MSTHNDGGPAFPGKLPICGEAGDAFAHFGGMTLRQYAAIHLRVPNSGDDWLDDMIREAQRNDFAAKAMAAFLSNPHNVGTTGPKDISSAAWGMADAMLVSRGAA